MAEITSQRVLEGQIERLPVNVERIEAIRRGLAEFVRRNGATADTARVRDAADRAWEAALAFDREIRIDWEFLKEQDPRWAQREAEYLAARSRGVGIGFLVAALIVALAAVGVLGAVMWDRQRRDALRAAEDHRAKYASLASIYADVQARGSIPDLIELARIVNDADRPTESSVESTVRAAAGGIGVGIAAAAALVLVVLWRKLQ